MVQLPFFFLNSLPYIHVYIFVHLLKLPEIMYSNVVGLSTGNDTKLGDYLGEGYTCIYYFTPFLFPTFCLPFCSKCVYGNISL